MGTGCGPIGSLQLGSRERLGMGWKKELFRAHRRGRALVRAALISLK
jgi:hypothetical protein